MLSSALRWFNFDIYWQIACFVSSNKTYFVTVRQYVILEENNLRRSGAPINPNAFVQVIEQYEDVHKQIPTNGLEP